MPRRFKEVAMVLCDRVKREAGTNKATIDGVFDRVFVAQLPAGVNCTLYLRVYPEDSTLVQAEIRLSLQRPNGSTETFPALRFNAENGRAEGTVNFNPLPILGYGKHRLILDGGPDGTTSVSFDAVEAQNASPQSN